MNISFEFFPPKTPDAQEKMKETLDVLLPLSPRFVSVTYGAGGSTKQATFDTTQHIVQHKSVPVAAHLTCLGTEKSEIETIARQYWDNGVRHIVALRGDAPKSGIPSIKEGYAYASDLVLALKKIAPFEISVAAYPETHPEATSAAFDLEMLKKKQDNGADRALTQFFFGAEKFLRFRDAALKAGITMPIVAGILPVYNLAQMEKFAALCNTTVPSYVKKPFEQTVNHSASIRDFLTAQLLHAECHSLKKEGVTDFHFYTLNRADIIFATCVSLGIAPDLLQY